MSELLVEEVLDTQDLAMAIRQIATGAPIVTKTTPTDPTDTGVTITGTGTGVLYVRPKVGATIDDYTLTVSTGGGNATRELEFSEPVVFAAAGRTIISSAGGGGASDWTVNHGIVAGEFVSVSGSVSNDRNGKLYRVLSVGTTTNTNDTLTLETTEAVTDETVTCTFARWHGGAILNLRRDPGTANVDLGNMTPGRGAIFEDASDEFRLQLRTVTNWVAADTLSWDIEANALVAASEDYTDNKTLVGTSNDNLIFEVEMYLSAPGISGTENINCNIETQSDFNADRYNLEMRGADGFVTSSDFNAQPNTSGPGYIAGSVNPMILWLTVSGDRIMFMVRAAAGVFEHGYLGFGDVLGDTGQHPRPIVVGTCADFNTVTPGNSNVRHSAYFDPTSIHASIPSNDQSSSFIHRWVDGQWFYAANKVSGGTRSTTGDLYILPRTSDGDLISASSNSLFSEGGFYSTSRPAPSSPSDEYQLIPITLVMALPDFNVILDLQGLFYVSGFAVNSEDTITIASDEYVIGNNVNATGQGDFVALRLTGP